MMRMLRIYLALILMVLIMMPARAVLAAARTASSGACKGWVQMTSRNASSGDNDLYGVTAVSASNVWAVGEYFIGVDTRTLIEHWNGKPGRWSRARTRDRTLARLGLRGVGVQRLGSRELLQRLDRTDPFEHWNGTAWKVVPEPERGIRIKRGCLGTGHFRPRHLGRWRRCHQLPGDKTVILHWNGQRWRLTYQPERGQRGEPPRAVRPVSRADGWAVGTYGDAIGSKTLILHWSRVTGESSASPTPVPGTNTLNGVLATPQATPGRSAITTRHRRQDPHPALERTALAEVAQSQRRVRQQQRSERDRRHVGQERLRGGRCLQRHELQGAHPALERKSLASHVGF